MSDGVRVPFTCRPEGERLWVEGYIRLDVARVGDKDAPVAVAGREDWSIKHRYWHGMLWSPVKDISRLREDSPKFREWLAYTVRDAVRLPSSMIADIRDRGRPDSSWADDGRRDLTDQPRAAAFHETARNFLFVDGVLHVRSLGPVLLVESNRVDEVWRLALKGLETLHGVEWKHHSHRGGLFRCDRVDEMRVLLGETGIAPGFEEELGRFSRRVRILIPEAVRQVDDEAMATLALARALNERVAGLQVRSAPRWAVRYSYDLRKAFERRDGGDPYSQMGWSHCCKNFRGFDTHGAEEFPRFFEEIMAHADARAILAGGYNEDELIDLLRLHEARMARGLVQQEDLDALEGIGHGL